MARNDRAIARANRNMQAIAQGISGNMDALYRSTYMSTPQQSRDLQDLGQRINASIDNIVSTNMNTIGEPSVTKLYARITDANKDAKSIVSGLDSMFDNGIMTEDLYGMFMSNRYLRELDTEIDTVCKYMPRLEEALDVQKDCVLSADHFSKDFLNLTPIGGTVDATVFSERIKDLKKKYKIAKLVEEIYEDTAKYGERFIYRVPFKTAIGKLLATKPDAQLTAPSTFRNESAISSGSEYYLLKMDSSNLTIIGGATASTVVTESASIMVESTSSDKSVKHESKPILSEKDNFSIGIEICTSNVLEGAVYAHKEAMEKKHFYGSTSMAHEQQVHLEANGDKKNIQAKGNIDWGENKLDDRLITTNDGLITGNKVQPIDVNVYGCVIRKLKRDHVIPIYIEDICMGYYYFEIRSLDNSDAAMGFKNLMGDPLTNLRGANNSGFHNTVDTTRQDDAIKFVAGQLSKFIDKKFVNHNQDLAREIYMILKYNELFNTPSIDMIKITFIPPEDMVHFHFRLDDETHRGISDLEKSLIPAKIYSSLYITDALARLTRGQDKRVYYVKQTVDTNIAQTLLNTISQIKQSNFGIRNFQNINNVLNITGRFNDFVIPTNASGEAPVQFEVMPGQDIQTPTELMDQLEEMAVNATGIPIEIIQARQSVDYAMQLTMSSSKVLRWCYKRQEDFESQLCDLITPMYNYEYNESIDIKVTLPPPSFINVTNTNQLVDNTKTFVQSLVEVELANEQNDQLKNAYTAALFNHYLGTHIDTSAHNAILNRCRLQIKAEANESHSDDAGGSDY